MVESVVIRPATPSDVPLVLSMVRALAAYEKMSDRMRATEADLANAMFGPRCYIEAVIAEAGGDAVGFASYFHNFSTFVGNPGLWIEDIFVLPAHRGCGYGRELFQALARVAAARGCGRMEWSALDWNEAAIGFYLEFGARKLDEWTSYRLDEAGIARLAQGGQGGGRD